MSEGRIIRSGGKDLAVELEEHGYTDLDYEPSDGPARVGATS